MNKNKAIKGFTLTEVMVTVAIIAIISTIAISSFSSYVKKGRRIDAVNALLSISLAEERYRSNNSQYGTLAQVWGGVTTSTEGYYSLAISGVSATGYTITATAQGNQATDTEGSTSCSSMVLTMSSGALTKTPAACWAT